MRQNYQELLAAGIRYFGTWRAAIEAAGIPYDSVRKYRDWSKERIIETIQRLEKDGRRSLLPLHDAQQVRPDGLRLDPAQPLRLVEGRPDRRRPGPGGHLPLPFLGRRFDHC